MKQPGLFVFLCLAVCCAGAMGARGVEPTGSTASDPVKPGPADGWKSIRAHLPPYRDSKAPEALFRGTLVVEKLDKPAQDGLPGTLRYYLHVTAERRIALTPFGAKLAGKELEVLGRPADGLPANRTKRVEVGWIRIVPPPEPEEVVARRALVRKTVASIARGESAPPGFFVELCVWNKGNHGGPMPPCRYRLSDTRAIVTPSDTRGDVQPSFSVPFVRLAEVCHALLERGPGEKTDPLRYVEQFAWENLPPPDRTSFHIGQPWVVELGVGIGDEVIRARSDSGYRALTREAKVRLDRIADRQERAAEIGNLRRKSGSVRVPPQAAVLRIRRQAEAAVLEFLLNAGAEGKPLPLGFAVVAGKRTVEQQPKRHRMLPPSWRYLAGTNYVFTAKQLFVEKVPGGGIMAEHMADREVDGEQRDRVIQTAPSGTDLRGLCRQLLDNRFLHLHSLERYPLVRRDKRRVDRTVSVRVHSFSAGCGDTLGSAFKDPADQEAFDRIYSSLMRKARSILDRAGRAHLQYPRISDHVSPSSRGACALGTKAEATQ